MASGANVLDAALPADSGFEIFGLEVAVAVVVVGLLKRDRNNVEDVG